MTSANDQRPESSRRRIVVPLGPAPGGPVARSASPRTTRPGPTPPRKGRAIRVLVILSLVLVALVLALAVGAFLGWQHYQTTPTYSLAVLVGAAQRNDMAGVDKIVDSDKIVDNFAGQVMDKAAGRYGS